MEFKPEDRRLLRPDTPKIRSMEKNEEARLFLLSETFTVDKAVEQLGFGKFQFLLSLLCGLAWVVDAMEVMILAIISPFLLCQWRLTSTQEAFITVVSAASLVFTRFGRC